MYKKNDKKILNLQICGDVTERFVSKTCKHKIVQS